MGNIITQNHGKVTAIDSETLNNLETRLAAAESAITTLNSEASSMRSDIESAEDRADMIEKLIVATGANFGRFVSGYYNLALNTTGISTVNSSDIWMCTTIPCNEGDVISINASGPDASGTYAFIGSDGLRIGDKEDGAVVNEEVTAPAGAVAILVNCGVNYANRYVACGSYDKEFADKVNSLIKYQSNQPGETGNKLWINSEDTQITVPTVTEMNLAIGQVRDAVNQLRQDVHDGIVAPPESLGPEFTIIDRMTLDNLGPASTKNVSNTVSPVGDWLPTEKAVYSHVENIINNLRLGNASRKDYVEDVIKSDALITSRAVDNYVSSKINELKTGAVTEIDPEDLENNIVTDTAVHNYVQDAIYNIDIPSPISQTIVTEISASPDDTTIPTSKAVADHVSGYVTETVGTLGTSKELDYATEITGKIPPNNKLPTCKAVSDYVEGTVSTIRSDVSALQGAKNVMQNAIGDIEDDIDIISGSLGSASQADVLQTVTSDTYNVPSSGAVKTYADAVNAEAQLREEEMSAVINNKMDAFTGVRFAEFRKGYWAFNSLSYIDLDNPTQDDGAVCAFIECVSGDEIHFRALGFGVNGTYCVTKDNGMIIPGSEELAQNGYFVIPSTEEYDGALFVAVNTSAAHVKRILSVGHYLTDVYDKIDEAEEKTKSVDTRVKRLETEVDAKETWNLVSTGAIIDDKWIMDDASHMVFHVNEGDTVQFFMNLETVIEYAFLETYDPGENRDPGYADGAFNYGMNVTEVGAGSETAAAGVGCHYLYVSFYHSGESFSPNMILINGYDVFSGLHEKIRKLSSMSLGMGGVHGNLGQADWALSIGNLEIYKKGSCIELQGNYSGTDDLLVRVTGTPRYSYATYDFEDDMERSPAQMRAYNMDRWEDHITGVCIQLQASCNGLPYNSNLNIDDSEGVVYPESFSDYNPIQFECYNYDSDINTVATSIPVLQQSICEMNDSIPGNQTYGMKHGISMAFDGSKLCVGDMDGQPCFCKPQGIVMRIKPNTDFDTSVEDFGWPSGSNATYTVYVENMDDEYAMSGRISGALWDIREARYNISTIQTAIRRTATSSANGLMSSNDKQKLDGFQNASAYVLKEDQVNALKYKGVVATTGDLNSLSNPASGDAYYVTGSNGVFIYNGSTWEQFGQPFQIEAISEATINSLFT